MSTLRVAACQNEPVVLRAHAFAGRVLRRMRNCVGYLLDARTLSGLSVSVALDELSALCRLVASRGLVRGGARLEGYNHALDLSLGALTRIQFVSRTTKR